MLHKLPVAVGFVAVLINAGTAHSADPWTESLLNPSAGSTYHVDARDAVTCQSLGARDLGPGQPWTNIKLVPRQRVLPENAAGMGAHINWIATQLPDKDKTVKRGSDGNCWNGDARYTATNVAPAKLVTPPQEGHKPPCTFTKCD
jgi:hypothetical protein